MKLHLGAFDRAIPGWLNTDVTPHLWVARVPFAYRLLGSLGLIAPERLERYRDGSFRRIRYLNAAKRFPLPDGCAEAVYSEHMLEHLYLDEARSCLRESFRVLRPGGICRVSVPDLDQIIPTYDPNDPGPFLHSLFESGNRKNAHHWSYNAVSLAALLRECGFRQTRRCEFRSGQCPELTMIERRTRGLYMEAVK